MDPLDMIQVCRKCYDEQRQHGTRDNAERLRNHGGCSCNPRLHQSNGQRNSFVYTVIDVNSGSLRQVRPLPDNYLDFQGKFKICRHNPCTRHYCTFAHDDLELQAWNKRKKDILDNKCTPPPSPLRQPPKLTRSISQVTSAADGKLTNMEHLTEFELLPDSKLDNRLLNDPLTRENYVDKFHTLLYYEEHEHVRVLEGRCDKSLKLSLFKSHGEMCGTLVGLDSNDVVYVQQAATHVEITIGRTTVRAEIAHYTVSKKGRDVVKVIFEDEEDYYHLKPKIDKTKSRTVSVYFVLKHSYFRDLHKSLDRVKMRTIDCLIPEVLPPEQNDLPLIPMPDNKDLWLLDKDYQLIALKKMMACDNSAPFLLTGPFGTGKTKILATAAYQFIKRRSNRVLICTSHLQSADAYIDKYFGPCEDSLQSYNVNPVRLAGRRYRYSGKYNHLVRRKGCTFKEKQQIRHSRLVITTFLTAPYLIDLRVKCFTHILIDEGAQTREPETIAPLGLSDDNTKIVIAGDHMQIGPQMLVLGDEALDNGLGRSLLQRLHVLYNELIENSTENPYTALLLTNYRCHDSIMRLPSNLFFESTLQVRAKNSNLHPVTSSALQFFCTSMDSSVVASKDDFSKEEAIATLEQVKHYIDPWPVAQWEDKDLSTICVMASSRNQVRMLRQLLKQTRFKAIGDVKVLATYELQGREFRAIFISTLEATNEDGSTRNPTKSICDQYTFNTIITRAQSLIVCVGNPFLLFSVEQHAPKYENHEAPIYCWREYVKRCLEANSFHLAQECRDSSLEKSISELQNEVFENLQKSLDSPCNKVHEVSDSILKAYKSVFQSNIKCKDVKVKIGSKNGDCCYVLQDSNSHMANEPVSNCHLLNASTECYLESITFRKAVATPLDSSQQPITINGVDNRRGALDGSLVKVALYEGGDHCGKVTEVLEQGPQRQFVCSVDSYNSISFCPVDRKSPKLFNLPGLSHRVLKNKAFNKSVIIKELEYKQHAVTVFDPQSFTNPNKEQRETIDIPQIKDVIPLKIAQNLLFVVWYLRWKLEYRYPLGVVIAAMPRGLTFYHAERMLLAHYNINIASVKSVESGNSCAVSATNSLSSLPQYPHALTIDPSDAKALDDALTLDLLTNQADGQQYRLGIHITNVGGALKGKTEIDKIARKRGTAVYGSKLIPSFYPMLPKKIRKNLSLNYNKETSAISITCIVFIADNNIKISNIKVHESCVCSRARLTYEEAQILLNRVKMKNSTLDNLVRDFNRALNSKFGLEQRLAVLLQISEFFFKDRTHSDSVNYTIEDEEVLLSPQAHFLVEEMMIWANRIAAEHVLAAFPKLTVLRRQKSPNQDQMTKALQQYEDAVNYSPVFKSLASKYSITSAPSSSPFIVMELFRNQLLRALQSCDIKQASNLLRVTSYHPQLAVLSKEVNRCQSRAQYVCSGNFQEQVKLEIQHGDYLVSLKDAPKEVYGHYNQCCLYTHFTSPLRRYIDIVMQRLILQSLSSPGANNLYTEDELKSICTECNASTLNANKFEREFNRLTLALSLAECSQPCTAYVANVEKSLQLIIRELDCQYLSPNQCSFRLSSITNSAMRSHVGAHDSETKSYTWRAKMTSFKKEYKIEKFANVKKHSSHSPELLHDLMIAFYCDEATVSTDSTSDGASAALVQQCYDAEFVSMTKLFDMEQWKKISDFMELPSEKTAKPLKELLMSHNSTENDNGVKFPTNASFWLYEVKQSFEAYKCFKISLAANFSDYILSPCIQLLEVAPMLNVCVQHCTNPASCFSTPILSYASRIKYNDISEYIGLWKNVLLAEAAVQSVSGDAEMQLIQNVPLRWPALEQPSSTLDDVYYTPIKSSDKKEQAVTLTIPADDFAERCGEYFDIQVGSLVCARYSIPLDKPMTVKDRPVHSANAVYHFVIDAIEENESNMAKTANKKQRSTSLTQRKQIRSDQTIHLRIVSSEAARVSSFMKPYLDRPCEIQLIPLDLPYKRMYRSLCSLEYADNLLCQEIALGGALTNKKSASRHVVLTTNTLIKRDKLVLSLWPHGQQQLNKEQEESVMTAIENKFQLIQGPPGTGKSVTGAHLAYAFIVANRKLCRSSKSPKVKCVMYCGPSNKSVDVVLDMFLKHPKVKDLRILRVYSKSIETKYYHGPHSSKVHSKPLSDQECDKDHEQFALHKKIRSKDCLLSTTILEMEQKFKRYSEEHKLPSSLEKREYNDLIKDAEEEMIRAGDYDIVFCTCNEACSVRIVNNVEPTHLIIDEAAMATEPEAMIPIQLADHITLIGDHMQLQPVITYNPAKERGLGCSLFQRYAEKDQGLLMLTTQYRMHEKICEFPSEAFYEGKLEAHPSVARQFCKLEGFWPMGPQCPIVFCDIEGKEDREEDSDTSSSHHKVNQESKSNKTEAYKIADIITALNLLIKNKLNHKKEPFKIAVLTPYKAQKELVRKVMHKKNLKVDISTINESQGSEYDFVIFSTVRSMRRDMIRNKAAIQPDRTWLRENLGFITDRHQICVAITRARHGLIIVGNAVLLSYDETWRNLLLSYDKSWDDEKKTYRGKSCIVDANHFPFKH